MPSKSKRRAELDQIRAEHTKVLMLTIIFGLATIAWLFALFYVSVSLEAWLVVLIVLGCLAEIFDYKRKRLARKIDVAEGVMAARGA